MSGQLVHWLLGSFVYLWSSPCGQWRGHVGQRPPLPELGIVAGGGGWVALKGKLRSSA